jgi:hypothetical protein
MNLLLRRANLFSLIFCVLGWTGATAAPLGASTEDPAAIKAALASAQEWLAEIDAGHFDQSYAEGCLAFHNKVSRAEWDTVLKSLRMPLGPVINRKFANYSYHPDGYEGLEGECMVITYNTSFSKLPSDLEVVVLKHEDGQWRGAGYNAQPQGEAESDSPPPADAQTEVTQKQVH